MSEELIQEGLHEALAGQLAAECDVLIDKHDLLYNHGPAMIHSIDPTGTIVSVSDRWVERFGYERSAVIGRKSVEFLTEESARYAADVLRQFQRDGFCRDVPYQFVCSDGSLADVLLSAIAERGPDGTFLRSFAVLQDVTELREKQHALEEEIVMRGRAEAKLEEQVDRLVRTNMALEQFTRASAHDLQSPLRNIETLVMMMDEDCGDSLNDEAKGYLQQIDSRVQKLRELLKDMLEFSRLSLSEVTLRDSDLNDALSRALDHIQQDADAVGAKISASDLPHAKINEGLVVQLFMNLIGNSIKYRSEDPQIDIRARTEGSMVIVSVMDNGIGIDREFADRIFEPLQRLHTHREYPGSGLGLAICRRIVELHDGTIWLNADHSPGTCFEFTLPAPDR